mmetsp:Transcript_10749/g.26002  ORF Transcript_10749/g.26002 Transcript_10749/m.26002 type:complete len:85 (+) Transcript_10749:319-573(+)
MMSQSTLGKTKLNNSSRFMLDKSTVGGDNCISTHGVAEFHLKTGCTVPTNETLGENRGRTSFFMQTYTHLHSSKVCHSMNHGCR